LGLTEAGRLLLEVMAQGGSFEAACHSVMRYASAAAEALSPDGKPATSQSTQEESVQETLPQNPRPDTAELPPLHQSAAPLSALDRKNRGNFLDNVYEIWITRFLEQSLEHQVWIELGLEERGDLLPNPWRVVMQEMEEVPRPLPAGTTIEQVYAQARQGQLLITGEPGSGKTTQMLHLAQSLIERARQDVSRPMPAVFNLSSWAQKQLPLTAWLNEELETKYKVPADIGRAWVRDGRLLPLLDGLDEVNIDDRPACVEAINRYLQTRWKREQGDSPLVICCRSQDYRDLSPRLAVQRVIGLLPLTDEQIDAYFQRGGTAVEVLWQAVRADPELHLLARQPLMLSVFTLAYQGADRTQLPLDKTAEEALHLVWNAYVDRMLRRRRPLTRWSEQQVRGWLTMLAQQMRQQSQTFFDVESLQGDWLPARYRRLFPWFIGLLVTALVGLVASVAFGPLGGGLAGVAFGMIGVVLVSIQKINPTERLGWTWKKFRVSLLGGVFVGIAFGGLASVFIGDVLRNMLIGILAGCFFGLLNGVAKSKIVERKILRPNEGIWRSGVSGVVVGLLSGLAIGGAVAVFNGLVFGVLSGLVFGVLSGVEKILRRNAGIWRYGVSGVVLAVFTGLALGVLGGVCFGVFVDAIKGLAGTILDGVVFGVFFGILDGGDAFLLHYFLRFWLWLSGSMPLRFVAFLDEMDDRLLLRRIGGGYSFVHRLLLEHFANGYANSLAQP
jgi:energy-coupling factor transporter ATP-binding protein EcfA2